MQPSLSVSSSSSSPIGMLSVLSSSSSPIARALLCCAGLFAYHLIPYLRNPVMSTMSEYDATMGPGQCGNGSSIILNWADPATVNACGAHVAALMQATLKPPHAAFTDSCKYVLRCVLTACPCAHACVRRRAGHAT